MVLGDIKIYLAWKKKLKEYNPKLLQEVADFEEKDIIPTVNSCGSKDGKYSIVVQFITRGRVAQFDAGQTNHAVLVVGWGKLHLLVVNPPL